MGPHIFVRNGKHMVNLRPDPPEIKSWDDTARAEWDERLLKEKRERRIMRKQEWAQLTPLEQFERDAARQRADIKPIVLQARALLARGARYEMLTSEQQSCLDLQNHIDAAEHERAKGTARNPKRIRLFLNELETGGHSNGNLAFSGDKDSKGGTGDESERDSSDGSSRDEGGGDEGSERETGDEGDCDESE
ncbi:hypothetical protein Moror_11814 [Moniliophthora roreri MCA 2997]|uniref:Uncharacterized protein n=2 Tax=Moniliophthora roreri TaxID=221103 RepID=V2W805_MONRO|nr:hypothetical protein Moror_11814 [Moniliophthora roreri MCA 2997]